MAVDMTQTGCRWISGATQLDGDGCGYRVVDDEVFAAHRRADVGDWLVGRPTGITRRDF